MGDLVFFFRSCTMESVLNHSRVKNIPVCKCIISVPRFGHVSYSWPGESRIVPIYLAAVTQPLKTSEKRNIKAIKPNKWMKQKEIAAQRQYTVSGTCACAVVS